MAERNRTVVPVMPKTRRADPLLSLVAEAKDGHWHELIEHLAGNSPITTRGRIAVAGLMQDLLEPQSQFGRPPGPANDENFLEQVAVLFMQRAAARFKKQQGRAKLRRGELELLANKAASKVNELMRKPGQKKQPGPKLRVANLIGTTNQLGVGSSRGFPYAKPASAEVSRWVRKNWHMLEAAIEHELVAALAAHARKAKH